MSTERSIGVLALQGDFHLHLKSLAAAGIAAFAFREVEEIPRLLGLVLPGGESTTQGMLLERRGLLQPLREAIAAGLPVFGTCAGAILLCNDIEDSSQLRIGGLDATVLRNAFGSQVDSFEHSLVLSEGIAGHEIEGVFIRAPRFVRVGERVTVLSQLDGEAVLVRQDNILAATFHPELTESTGLHRYFAEVMCGARPV